MDVRLRHELACDQDVYWEQCVFDQEYSQKLFLELLKFPRYEVLELVKEGPVFRKKTRIEPPVTGVPGPVKKVIGDKLAYVEDGSYDRAAHRYTFNVIPSVLPEKTKVSGAMWTEPLGPKRCARHLEIKVEVKVFVVGSLIEEKIAQDLRASYEASVAFTDEFTKAKGL